MSEISAGFSGAMAVVSGTVVNYGGKPGKAFSAVFDVVNGTIASTIDDGGFPAQSVQLEKLALGLLAGFGIGLILPGGAFGIIAGGAVAVFMEAKGDDLSYDFYKKAQEKAFQLFNDLTSDSNHMDGMHDTFGRAESTTSSIILDLDGDGVETTGIKAGAHFDHAGDGFAEQTGWVAADDGLLVYDRNGDGRIESGAELFGNNTFLANGTKAANGFDALRELDDTHDGRIDARDTAFISLRVWKDTDDDGYTSDGELLTLEQVGVQSIGTDYSNTTFMDANGNAHMQEGDFSRTGGSTATMSDVWFGIDSMHTIAQEWLPVPEDIAALPDLQGYGRVYSLHQAMIRDVSGHLKTLVRQFTVETDPAARTALVTQIIYAWAGVENKDPNSRAATRIYGNAITAR